MPHSMSSKNMLKLGLIAAVIGVIFALTGTAMVLQLLDTLPLGSMAFGMLNGAIGALQQIFFIGGLFMVITSFMMRHYEILKEEVQQADGGEVAV